jgi:transposase
MRTPKTHCPHGHEYTETNARRLKSGSIACRECGRTAFREWNARRNARLGTLVRTPGVRAAEARECRRLRSEGRTVQEIAGSLSLHPSTVYERLKLPA